MPEVQKQNTSAQNDPILKTLDFLNEKVGALNTSWIKKDLPDQKTNLLEYEVTEEIRDQVHQLLAERYKKINPKENLYDVCLINSYNLLYGDHTPIQELDDPHYKDPASSLIVMLNGIVFSSYVKTGPPPKVGLLRRSAKYNETRAYEYAINPLYEKYGGSSENVDRIFTFSKNIKRFAHGAYVLSELERQLPGTVMGSMENLDIFINEDNGINQTGIVNQVIGFLQVLEQFDILMDPRFSALSIALRDIAMKYVPTYELLKSKYSHSVMRQSSFWVAGQIKQQKSIEPQKDTASETESLESDVTTTICFPSLEEWKATTQKILTLNRRIQTNSDAHILKTRAIETSLEDDQTRLDKIFIAVRADLAGRAVEKTTVRTLKKQLIRKYQLLFGRELSYLHNGEQLDPALFLKCLQALAHSAKDNEKLSQKSHGWLQKIKGSEEENVGTEYALSHTTVENNPLFHWVSALKTAENRKNLLNVIQMQPLEGLVLFRMMVHALLSTIIFEQEDEYLLLSGRENLEEEIKEAEDFFQTLCKIFEEAAQSQETIVRELGRINEKVEDIVDKKNQRRQKEKTEKWLTRPLFLGIRVKHQFGITLPDESIMYFSLIGAMFAVTGMYVALLEKNYNEIGAFQNYLQKNPEKSLTPDQINRDALKQLQPSFYGKIFHVPESEKNLQQLAIPISVEDYITGGIVGDPLQKPFEHVVFGGIPEQFIPTSNSLVYQPDVINGVLYPPLGYKFVQFFQDGGGRPNLRSTGEIIWSSSGEVPKKLVVVAEPLSIDSDSLETAEEYDGIVMYKNIRTSWYTLSNLDYQKAVEYNRQLASDPTLQKLHMQMVNELDVIQHINQKLNNPEYLSNFIIKYSSRFWQYVQDQRFYALDLHDNKQDHTTKGSYLKTIADYPNSGYFCGFAARSFQDFWSSVDVHANYESVLPTAIYGDELWNHIGHANTRIYLPNGKIAYIDTTPPVREGKTPPEDLDALKWKSPQEANPDILAKIKKFSQDNKVSDVAALFLALAAMKLGWGALSNSLVMRKLENMLKNSREMQFDELENKMLASIAVCVSQLNFEDKEKFAEHAAQFFRLLLEVRKTKFQALITWTSDEFIPKSQSVASPEKLLTSLEDLKSEVFQEISESWLSDRHGVQDMMPLSLRAELTKQLQSGGSIQGLNAELDTAVEMGVLMGNTMVMKIADELKATLATQSVREFDEVRGAAERSEKIALLTGIIISLKKEIVANKKNGSYLAFLAQAMID